MSEYKEMYYKLFIEVTKAINILENAQIETEDIFINKAEDNANIFNTNQKTDVSERSF